jgi:PIN domain nuclease of toxin-antitoxin system
VDLLLDTNVLLWALGGDPRLGRASSVIADRRNRVYVSAASGWEIAIKLNLGKLKVPPNLATWLPRELASTQFTVLPISLAHTMQVEHLPHRHADPFDRLLIAQAMQESLDIVTGDPQFENYGVRVLKC